MARLGRYFLPDQPLHATQRDDRNRLFAPTRGIVRQISVHTIGEVVAPGETLMTIVPVDADLEVEAFLLNRDKGFVHAAQEAEIKVEAFPFTKYGTVPGEVVDVSNNSVEDEKRGLILPAVPLMPNSSRPRNISPFIACRGVSRKAAPPAPRHAGMYAVRTRGVFSVKRQRVPRCAHPRKRA